MARQAIGMQGPTSSLVSVGYSAAVKSTDPIGCLSGLATACMKVGDRDDVVRISRQLSRMARMKCWEKQRDRILVKLCRIYVWGGRLAQAFRVADRASPSGKVYAVTAIGREMHNTGRVGKARALGNRLIEMLRADEQPERPCLIVSVADYVLSVGNDGPRALALASQAWAAGTKERNASAGAWLLSRLGEVFMQMDEKQDGLGCLAKAKRFALKQPPSDSQVYDLLRVADAYHNAKLTPKAIDLVQDACGIAHENWLVSICRCAEHLHKYGDTETALRILEGIHKIAARQHATYTLMCLAGSFTVVGALPTAERILEYKSARRSELVPLELCRLAEEYNLAGNEAKALEHLRKALRIAFTRSCDNFKAYVIMEVLKAFGDSEILHSALRKERLCD